MFKISQKVVCIDANFDERAKAFYTSLPEQDKVYVIRDVIDGGDWKGEPSMAVYLVGLVNPNSSKPPFFERGFHERRFRPLEELPPAVNSERELVGVGIGEGRDTSEDWKKAT
jgi:hypothetical protein